MYKYRVIVPFFFLYTDKCPLKKTLILLLLLKPQACTDHSFFLSENEVDGETIVWPHREHDLIFISRLF